MISHRIRQWFGGNGAPGAESGPGSTPINQRLRKIVGYVFLGVIAFLLVVFSGVVGRRIGWPVKEVGNVHYIDSVGPNFLFRGGLPLTGNPPVFNYQGLKRAVINAGQRAGVRVPDSFYVIDVNLLNIENPSDAERIMVEQKFFQAHPRLGRIQVWGMNGTGLHANDPALAECRTFLARNLDQWLNDRLGNRIETLRKWLEEPGPVVRGKKMPVVIYIHCVAGCDRTGEFSAAYYLRYMNKSWEEVNALNRSLCRHNRPFRCQNYRAAQWYSLWLNLERGFSLNWWKEFPCGGK